MTLKFSKLPLVSFVRRFTVSLEAVLSFGWWALLAILGALLLADAFLFYLYGLGYAELAAPPGGEAVFRLHEETIRNAAAKLEERQVRFESVATTTSNLPNPFR